MLASVASDGISMSHARSEAVFGVRTGVKQRYSACRIYYCYLARYDDVVEPCN